MSARDSDRATPLVLACIHGHVECVQALLGAGASPFSKWQFLEPIQWAVAYGHDDCANVLEGLTRVANASRVPRGRSTTVTLLDRTVNRLLPIPSRIGSGSGGGSSCAADDVGTDAAGRGDGQRRKMLHLALCKYFYGNKLGKKQLPASVQQSISVRPGIVFGRSPSRQDHQRSVAPTVKASIFGHQLEAHPEFVAIDPQFTDPVWANWFGELVLAFACVDEHGQTHELMLLRWLWASTETLVRDERGEYSEVPYRTRYGLQNKYEVLSVGSAMHRAPVFRPPRFADPEREVRLEPYIWAPDLYGIF